MISDRKRFAGITGHQLQLRRQKLHTDNVGIRYLMTETLHKKTHDK